VPVGEQSQHPVLAGAQPVHAPVEMPLPVLLVAVAGEPEPAFGLGHHRVPGGGSGQRLQQGLEPDRLGQGPDRPGGDRGRRRGLVMAAGEQHDLLALLAQWPHHRGGIHPLSGHLDPQGQIEQYQPGGEDAGCGQDGGRVGHRDLMGVDALGAQRYAQRRTEQRMPVDDQNGEPPRTGVGGTGGLRVTGLAGGWSRAGRRREAIRHGKLPAT
jgi:hypothetical protein